MLRSFLFLALLLITSTLTAQPLSRDKVPAPLKPWVDWVLYDATEYKCPFLYHNDKQRRCAWPSRLRLKLAAKGGEFRQQWQVYQRTWITLPGSVKHWPQSVKVNNKPAVVLKRNGKPVIRLVPGSYTVNGRFLWQQLPESLAVPPDTGIIGLTIHNRKVASPELNQDGRLWLREREADENAQGKADKLEMEVFRQIVDDLPLRIITRIQLNVSGSQREVLLGRALLDDAIPLRLSSRLPARLEPDGRLRIQVRPGRWNIELETRYAEDVTAFTLPASPQPWPRQEVWVFKAYNALRLVEVEGNSVDPRQTGLPETWQSLPAYLMKVNDSLRLKVIRRGDPEPEPDQLRLERTLWLDFAGSGYTLHDVITGSMTRGWRLETGKALQLGRVDIDGQPRFITRLGDSGNVGVEVRRGIIHLTADSRYTRSLHTLPATGWARDFRHVSTTLNLPPGWSLFSATGVDNVPQTWVNRWSLLDLFLVLILSLSILRLWNWRWGLFALLSLALSWHEDLAPQLVWINILLAIALLNVVPEGKFKRVVLWYRNLSLLSLILILVPFSVQQVRTGLYPQLERPGLPVSPVAMAPREEARLATPIKSATEAVERSKERYLRKKPSSTIAGYGMYGKAVTLDQIDPRATVQTGPGLPIWSWTTVHLSWNGPVKRDQQIGLWLIPPSVNTVLHFLRVILLLILAALMLGVRYHGGRKFTLQSPFGKTLLLLFLLGGLPGLPASDVLAATPSNATPSAEILQQLKARLLASPACLPRCAQISRMQMEITPRVLTLRLEIHAGEKVAIPLPSHSKHWLPGQVMLDGKAANSLYREAGGGLWLALKRGRHQVVMRGALPPRSDLSLPLPLKPQHVSVRARGWTVEGVHEDGEADKQLQLTRIRQDENQPLSALQPGQLPPFVRVERTLRLGLNWYVETRVVRASPDGVPVVLEVPLLRGESPITEGIRSVQHRVLISMSPSQKTFRWRSVLDKQVHITLVAPQTTEWVEIWRVDVSPVWHLRFRGLAVVHHQDEQQNWLPEWRPWPGERVSLDITRPEGVEGRTLTIDNSRLRIKPGQRATETTLELTLRSSQGGQHQLQLPAQAKLQSASINGQTQPIRQEGRSVTLPIVPGKQAIRLVWRSDKPIQTVYQTEAVDIGSDNTNANTHIQLGRDRWILFAHGPRLGPAVLYWGVLIVLALLALILGRINLTPLKGRQWFLLGIGLSQVSLGMAAFIVAWLLALGWRSRMHQRPGAVLFNSMQLGLGLMSLLSLGFLFLAVQQGLLGLPEMHVSGNASSAYDLNWYQDRSSGQLPHAWVFSVPLFVYRLLMLAWALWLAFALLKWLRWGWQCVNQHGLWITLERKKTKALAATGEITPDKDTE